MLGSSSPNTAHLKLNGDTIKGTGVRGIDKSSPGTLTVRQTTVAGTFTFGFDDRAASGTAAFTNCAFKGTGTGTAVRKSSTATPTVDHCGIHGWATAASSITPTNTVTDDPGFDAELRITTESPYYQAGIVVDGARDRFGKSVLQTPSIGSYEPVPARNTGPARNDSDARSDSTERITIRRAA